MVPDEVRFRIDNQSNGQVWETAARVTRLPDGLRLDYADGIKASTLFRVEPADAGSLLWIVDDYGRLTEAEREARVAEVDRSLTAWGGGPMKVTLLCAQTVEKRAFSARKP